MAKKVTLKQGGKKLTEALGNMNYDGLKDVLYGYLKEERPINLVCIYNESDENEKQQLQAILLHFLHKKKKIRKDRISLPDRRRTKDQLFSPICL